MTKNYIKRIKDIYQKRQKAHDILLQCDKELDDLIHEIFGDLILKRVSKKDL